MVCGGGGGLGAGGAVGFHFFNFLIPLVPVISTGTKGPPSSIELLVSVAQPVVKAFSLVVSGLQCPLIISHLCCLVAI